MCCRFPVRAVYRPSLFSVSVSAPAWRGAAGYFEMNGNVINGEVMKLGRLTIHRLVEMVHPYEDPEAFFPRGNA